eukprot:3484-Heterococcus_DN1.PRE.2
MLLLVSTRCTALRAALKSGKALEERSRPAISVPLPGPASTMWKELGQPRSCQVATHQMHSSSPNSWLISGAVMKSPLLPMTSAPERV